MAWSQLLGLSEPQFSSAVPTGLLSEFESASKAPAPGWVSNNQWALLLFFDQSAPISAKCCCTQFFAVLSLGNLGTTLHQRGRRICFFVSWEKRKRAKAVRSWPAPASWGQRGVYQNDLLSPPQSGPVEKVPPGTTDAQGALFL